ncbi:MAG: DUF2493 domain-containing protein [Paracoccus sp. (in: a-proteobacteria)]|uniref:DUF2493 domain-containing protein n=1 Tax=Paracoccus sp. TaxID=267 RepID=UPI0032D9784D
MRVIVCGGRDFSDRAGLYAALDRFRSSYGITCVIQGAAPGADIMAYDWAADRRVMVINEPAMWKTHGKSAGPIRNQLMIDEHKPNAVIAFPGGVGTADMIKRAKAASIPVYVPAT